MISGDLRWDLIGVGAVIGVAVIILDEVARRMSGDKIKLPPLAVGIGFYLPAAVTFMLVIGAVCGFIYNRTVAKKSYGEVARRMGVLLASGLIVGESLFGVLNAATIVGTGNAEWAAVLGLGDGWPAMTVGIAVFAVLTLVLYRWIMSRSAKV